MAASMPDMPSIPARSASSSSAAIISSSASLASMYSAAVVQVRFASSAPRTYLRGTASTRLNRSAASSVSAYTVDNEHMPSSTVVTPWRTDSRSPGSSSTSAS